MKSILLAPRQCSVRAEVNALLEFVHTLASRDQRLLGHRRIAAKVRPAGPLTPRQEDGDPAFICAHGPNSDIVSIPTVRNHLRVPLFERHFSPKHSGLGPIGVYVGQLLYGMYRARAGGRTALDAGTGACSLLLRRLTCRGAVRSTPCRVTAGDRCLRPPDCRDETDCLKNASRAVRWDRQR
jgi:hypothetical protein